PTYLHNKATFKRIYTDMRVYPMTPVHFSKGK
ncbi:unnamed protein product, partial [marine sediment metagenome]